MSWIRICIKIMPDPDFPYLSNYYYITCTKTTVLHRTYNKKFIQASSAWSSIISNSESLDLSKMEQLFSSILTRYRYLPHEVPLNKATESIVNLLILFFSLCRPFYLLPSFPLRSTLGHTGNSDTMFKRIQKFVILALFLLNTVRCAYLSC